MRARTYAETTNNIGQRWDEEQVFEFAESYSNAENAALKAKLERMSAPVSGKDKFHYEDDEVLANVGGTEYLKLNVRRMLTGRTTGERWSLYRAIAKMSHAALLSARAQEPPAAEGSSE